MPWQEGHRCRMMLIQKAFDEEQVSSLPFAVVMEQVHVFLHQKMPPNPRLRLLACAGLWAPSPVPPQAKSVVANRDDTVDLRSSATGQGRFHPVSSASQCCQPEDSPPSPCLSPSWLSV